MYIYIYRERERDYVCMYVCIYIYIYIYIYSTTGRGPQDEARATRELQEARSYIDRRPPLLAFGRLARPRVWSCTNAQSCAIAQWLKGAAVPTLRTQTKSVHEFYCSGGKWRQVASGRGPPAERLLVTFCAITFFRLQEFLLRKVISTLT